MLPIDQLMQEHRLIERVIAVMNSELRRTQKEQRAAPGFIATALDFFNVYADRTHHLKEEDILFRDLRGKPLAPELRQLVDELIGEHGTSRETRAGLTAAREDYVKGNTGVLDQVVTAMRKIVTLYPKHIDKEDNRLFYPAMDYFTDEEQHHMLHEFWESDRKMIHDKYQQVVEELVARNTH